MSQDNDERISIGRLERAARGFTLLELVIVMALVGVIAAVSIPSLQRMQQRARTA
jgi:type IV pilus assembly protein PilA